MIETAAAAPEDKTRGGITAHLVFYEEYSDTGRGIEYMCLQNYITFFSDL